MNKEIAKKLTDVVAGQGSNLWQIDDDNWVGVAWTGDGRILILHEDKICEYKDDEAWETMCTFLEPLESSGIRSGLGPLPAVTPSKVIKWKLASSNTQNQTVSIAQVESQELIFIHAPNGDWSSSHDDIIINYETWDGTNWTAKVKVNADGSVIFTHAPNGDWSKSHDDTIINYKTWDGTNWTAKAKVNSDGSVIFTHAPNGDWSKSHDDTIINYKTWGGTNWTAKVKVKSGSSAIPPAPAPEPAPLPKPADPDIIITAIADVYMSNLVYKGQVKRTQSDEYVELTNRGNKAADISGWKITSAGSAKQWFIFPAGSALGAGKSLRIYTNEVHPETGGYSFASKTAIWNDAGDELNLFNAKGENVATLTYGKARKK
jgi:hypothetical protein